MLDEREAALRAKQGDPEAFGTLVRKHEELAFRAAYLVVRDAPEAQDIAQEAFVRAYRSLNRFDAEQPFRPWLLRIVTNLAFNSRRGAKRRYEAGQRYERSIGEASSSPSPESEVVRGEEARRIWSAVSKLDRQDQEVLYLRYFLDASETETAAALGRPPGTVKSRLHRALRRLRAVIEERYPDLTPAEVSKT